MSNANEAEQKAFNRAFTERAVENALERAAQLATIHKFTRASFMTIAKQVFDEESARMERRVKILLGEIKP